MSYYIRDLDHFNPTRHYIRAEKGRIEVKYKSDLNWLSRLVRLIWKPKEERIEYIVQAIWNQIAPNEIKPDHLHYEGSSPAIFKSLFTLFSKSKSRNTFRLVDLYNTYVSQREQTLSGVEANISTKNHELFGLQCKLNGLEEQISKTTEFETKRLSMESDTVIWIEEDTEKADYVLFSSALFDKTSIINSDAMNFMNQKSAKINEKLSALEKHDRDILESMPKHMYAPNLSKKDLIHFRTILEQGPNAVLLYPRRSNGGALIQDYSAEIQAVADFFCQSLDNTTAVKVLEDYIKAKTPQPRVWKQYDRNGNEIRG